MVENKVKMVHLQERLALTEAKLTMNNKDVRLHDLKKELLIYIKSLHTLQEALQTQYTQILKL